MRFGVTPVANVRTDVGFVYHSGREGDAKDVPPKEAFVAADPAP